MQEIRIPTREEIDRMSQSRCQSERTRLRNEISFARGNAMWGGPSSEGLVAALRCAIDVIEHRLYALTASNDSQYTM